MAALLMNAQALHDAADDLRTLAWLHAAERDAATWAALHEAGFPQGLSLAGELPANLALAESLAALAQTLQAAEQDEGVDAQGTGQADDALAADYADIYLTHAFKASPYESVWRDEDGLMMQAPTFEVRACYRQHGMAVPDWRQMPDDHLAHELAFVAHLLAQGQASAAARFLDDHLLAWLPQFAERVAQRARTTVYAGLARLTLVYCQQLRPGLGEAAPAMPPAARSATESASCSG